MTTTSVLPDCLPESLARFHLAQIPAQIIKNTTLAPNRYCTYVLLYMYDDVMLVIYCSFSESNRANLHIPFYKVTL